MQTIQSLRKRYHPRIAPLDLELLFSFVLKKPHEFILAHPEYCIAKNQESRIMNYAKRRMSGEPIAYILGQKEFYELDFKVNKNTLVPRPETELLVDLALEEVRKHLHTNVLTHVSTRVSTTNIIDIGTGSGNIIISIARQLMNQELKIKNQESGIINYEFYGTDISRKALAIAKQNAERHKLDKKIKFLSGSLLNSMSESWKLKAKSWIILANLPYLDTGWKNLLKSTETKALKFEPSVALYAGKDGLDAYRKLAKQLRILSLKTDCPITVFCEIGHLQKKEMQKIFSFAQTAFHKDLAGKWRVCEIKL